MKPSITFCTSATSGCGEATGAAVCARAVLMLDEANAGERRCSAHCKPSFHSCLRNAPTATAAGATPPGALCRRLDAPENSSAAPGFHAGWTTTAVP